MKNNIVQLLSDLVEKAFEVKTQKEISNILGIHQAQLSNYLKNPIYTDKSVLSMIENFSKEYARRNSYTETNTTSILADLVTKEYAASSQSEISKYLGIQQTQLSYYQKNNQAGPKAIRGMIESYTNFKTEELVKKVINPVLEFKKIKPTKFSSKYILLPTEHNKDALKEVLEKKVGIYLFYNSQGKNIYIGKTEKDLYIEITQQLGRVIKIYAESLKPTNVQQGDITSFISVYEIKPKALIKDLEALLIRAYANDNTNIKMENFNK